MSRDLLPVKRFRFLDGQLATGDNGNNSSSDDSYHTAVEEEDSEHGVVEESRAKRRKRKQARSGRTNSDAPDRFLASALEKRTPQVCRN